MTHAQCAVGNYFAVGLEMFVVRLLSPCALYLQMSRAQFAVGRYFAVGQQSCIMPCGRLCRVSRHGKDSIQIARSPSQHHSLPTRVSFAVRKHTAEDIWFLCRVQAHGKVPVFSLF
jgi:hypothetical protein